MITRDNKDCAAIAVSSRQHMGTADAVSTLPMCLLVSVPAWGLQLLGPDLATCVEIREVPVKFCPWPPRTAPNQWLHSGV